MLSLLLIHSNFFFRAQHKRLWEQNTQNTVKMYHAKTSKLHSRVVLNEVNRQPSKRSFFAVNCYKKGG